MKEELIACIKKEEPIACIKCDAVEGEMYGCDETCEFYCATHFQELGCADHHPEDCMTKVFQDEPSAESEEFLISREALDEAHSALYGAREALGDIANISCAIEKLKTARGNLGDTYNGH